MSLPVVKSLLLPLLLSATCMFYAADAHGYVDSPRSRNERAHEEGKEYDQNGLNRKASDGNTYGSGLCGVTSSGHNYDTYLDGEWKSEKRYHAGQTIRIKSRITAYHGGHIEVGACTDAEPTQDCFDRNKLDYVGGGHAVDPSHPERAYLGIPSYRHGKQKYVHKFRLPESLSGDRVLLQWRYFTANSCVYQGYDEYFSAQGWGASNLGQCDEGLLDDVGSTAPERFWNCMEITIKSWSGSLFKPVTRPTKPDPTPIKGARPQVSADSSTCRAHSRTCGPNQPCRDGACCSEWGYCGFSRAHCLECCQSNCFDNA